MTGAWSSAVRGWCPDLFAPMPSGDGLLLRIKPRFGRLEATSATALARGAMRHGNGRLEVTNRGNLQLRGFTERSAASFAAEALSLGLAHPDPAAEARRNILVSPLAGDDPGCDADTRGIALAIEAALPDPAFAHLPAKFGLLVDGGGLLPLHDVVSDIAVRAGANGWRVEAGGATLCCTAAAAAGVALQLALVIPPGVRPSRNPASGAALFAAAGYHATPVGIDSGTRRDSPDPGICPGMPPARRPPVAVGPIGASLFGIGAPPGQFDAVTLRLLAELSVRLGDGVLRFTPFRSVLVGGMDATGLRAVRTVLSDRLIDPADPRLRTASCIGEPGCAHASVPAPADASRLAAFVPDGALLHVSGCDKGCGHPAPAPFVLVGRNGRYDLVRDGRAGDAPVLRDIAPDHAAEAIRSLPA